MPSAPSTQHTATNSHGPDRPTKTGLLTWFARATALGLSVSIFVHVFGSIILGSIIVGQQGVAQGRADDGRGTTVALSPVETLADPTPPASPSAASGGLPSAVTSVIETAPPLDPNAIVALETAATTSTSFSTDFGLGDITGTNPGGGGASGTSFFGLKARGNRFAYVVDTSGSMLGDRIARLRDELYESIKGLDDNADFYVIRYSNTASSLGDMRRWVDASPQGKAWARRSILTLQASGSTIPVRGFDLLRNLTPKPDAIFFMTDGQFGPAMTNEILRIQTRLDAPIHCVTFGDDTGADDMKRIAEATGGQYRHVSSNQ